MRHQTNDNSFTQTMNHPLDRQTMDSPQSVLCRRAIESCRAANCRAMSPPRVGRQCQRAAPRSAHRVFHRLVWTVGHRKRICPT